MATLDSSGLTKTFDLLTHPFRRYVLYYLTNESEVVEIDTLATAIVQWEGDHSGTDRADNIKEVKTGLHHIHLPKLADAGVITFDPNMDSIELGQTDGLDRFLGDTAPIDGYTPIIAGD